MDTTKLGLITATAMEQIERDFQNVSDAELGESVLVYEVFYTDEEGNKRNEVGSASTTDNRIHQTGILDWGLELVKDTGNPTEQDDEDEDDS